ncbi:MAG: SDR family NAD(P)-dependent oxidoreductase, partial [Actinomycetes bacterium]
MQLEGRVALVTGASSGVGAATAVSLAREGALVALAARRVERLLAVAVDIEQLGGQAHVIQTDLRDTKQVTNMVKQAVARWGRLDILVNNAG